MAHDFLLICHYNLSGEICAVGINKLYLLNLHGHDFTCFLPCWTPFNVKVMVFCPLWRLSLDTYVGWKLFKKQCDLKTQSSEVMGKNKFYC